MGFGRIFLFIFVFALLEAMVLAKVAELTGWVFTILATVATAMLGSLLFRWQGVETLTRLNQRMQQGQLPGHELVEGVMLLLGGALLITPGFITDAIGFVLLLPQTRKALAAAAVRRGTLQAFAQRNGQGGAFVYTHTQYREYNPEQPPQDSPQVRETRDGHLIIEGQAERKDD
ncbi:MAG: FxsA family protein [Gammaproteobacteria bacterium]